MRNVNLHTLLHIELAPFPLNYGDAELNKAIYQQRISSAKYRINELNHE